MAEAAKEERMLALEDEDLFKCVPAIILYVMEDGVNEHTNTHTMQWVVWGDIRS